MARERTPEEQEELNRRKARAIGGPVTAQDKARAERRRAIVAENYLAGRRADQIAEALGESESTIKKDLMILRQRWREQQQASVSEAVDFQNARLERIIALAWQKMMEGDGQAWDRVLKALESQRKLLGLDAAVKQDVTVRTEDADSLERKLEELAERLQAPGPEG